MQVNSQNYRVIAYLASSHCEDLGALGILDLSITVAHPKLGIFLQRKHRFSSDARTGDLFIKIRMSNSDKKKSKEKDSKKAAMKEEAARLGISYDELKKKEKKRKKREAETLESEEHLAEIKRMRTWSKDYDGDGAKKANQGGTTAVVAAATGTSDQTGDDGSNKRRRTRSMDVAEEQDAKIMEEKKLSPMEWRAQHNLNLRGHGAYSQEREFAAPYIQFSDAPFSARIQETLKRAGFALPTAIQAQAWPLAIEGKDLISIAKTGSGYVVVASCYDLLVMTRLNFPTCFVLLCLTHADIVYFNFSYLTSSNILLQIFKQQENLWFLASRLS